MRKLFMMPVHFIVGWYSYFIQKEYSRLFSEESIKDVMQKAAACHECVINGSCMNADCGCDINAVFLSDKKCPAGKW